MKVEFERIAGDAEAYSLIGEPEPGVILTLGRVTRVAENEWKFEAAAEDGVIAVGPMVGQTIEASSLEELKKGFQCNHLGRISLPRNALADKTMERFADAQLHNMLALANKTNSFAGYTAALADAFAQMLHECFDTPEKRDSAMEAVFDRIKTGLKLRAEAEAKRPAADAALADLAQQLKRMFGEILGGDDEDTGKPNEPARPTH